MPSAPTQNLSNDPAGVPRRWLPRVELVRRLRTAQADAGLRADLARLAGETTDDLPPIR